MEAKETMGLQVGQKIFPTLKPTATQKVVIRSLSVMSVPNAAHFTWKAVRAGHATEMASKGASLAAILAAGEWRSAAFLHYVDANVADATEVLRTTLQMEIDEASDAEP